MEQLKKKWDYKKTILASRELVHFHIEKAGRFTARFIQLLLGAVCCYLLSLQNATLFRAHEMDRFVVAMLGLMASSMVCSVLLVLLYALPWMSDAWTPRRILRIETIADLLLCFPPLLAFCLALSRMQGHCMVGANPVPADVGVTPTTCTHFNVLVAWLFLTFLGYVAGLWFDVASWYAALWRPQEVDSRILLDIRRSTRSLPKSNNSLPKSHASLPRG